MIINNVGYNHCHDADFYIDRPNGSGDYLLLIVKSGAIFNIDGEDIETNAGTFFLYPKGRPQHYRCVPMHTFENDWIHFDFEDADIERDFLSHNIPIEIPIYLGDTSFYSYCIKSITYENFSDNKYKDLSIRNYFFLMVIKLLEFLEKTDCKVPKNKYEVLSTIRSKIYARPYENRDISGTCHEVTMSRSAFQHSYKKQFGVSFIQDLNNARIEYAVNLLLNTNISIRDVASQCGFGTYEHFERVFKEKFNMTPIKFRKNSKQNL